MSKYTSELEVTVDDKGASKVLANYAKNLRAAMKAQQDFLVSMNQSVNTRAIDQATAASKKLNQANRERIVTTQRLATQEGILHGIYVKNSDAYSKRYLSSMRGYTLAVRALDKEFANTIVRQKGFTKHLSDSDFAAQRAAIKYDLLTKTIMNIGQQAVNTGKNLQWTGRQLMVGITAPVLGATGAAVKLYKELGQAELVLRKLTGNKGTERLTREARELSEHWGVARTELTKVQSTFAAIGFDTKTISKLTELTVKFSKLGDIDLTTAGEMIRVIKQSGVELSRLEPTLAKFNLIEDKTNLNMKEIAVGLPKVFPIFKQYGDSAETVAAAMAAITQGGIPATEAANSLKATLVKLRPALANIGAEKDGGTRLKALREVLSQMSQFSGKPLNLFGKDGKAIGGIDTILMIAEAFKQVETAAKGGNVAAGQMIEEFIRAAGGATQGARLTELLSNVGKSMDKNTKLGQDFAKALQIARHESSAAMEAWAKQLGAVEDADVTKLAGQLESLKNSAQEIGRRLVPVVTTVLKGISKIFNFFENLPDGVQKVIGMVAGIAAILGPILYGVGIFKIVQGVLIRGFGHVRGLVRHVKVELDTLGADWQTVQDSLQEVRNEVALGKKTWDDYNQAAFQAVSTMKSASKVDINRGPKLAGGLAEGIQRADIMSAIATQSAAAVPVVAAQLLQKTMRGPAGQEIADREARRQPTGGMNMYNQVRLLFGDLIREGMSVAQAGETVRGMSNAEIMARAEQKGTKLIGPAIDELTALGEQRDRLKRMKNYMVEFAQMFEGRKVDPIAMEQFIKATDDMGMAGQAFAERLKRLAFAPALASVMQGTKTAKGYDPFALVRAFGGDGNLGDELRKVLPSIAAQTGSGKFDTGLADSKKVKDAANVMQEMLESKPAQILEVQETIDNNLSQYEAEYRAWDEARKRKADAEKRLQELLRKRNRMIRSFRKATGDKVGFPTGMEYNTLNDEIMQMNRIAQLPVGPRPKKPAMRVMGSRSQIVPTPFTSGHVEEFLDITGGLLPDEEDKSGAKINARQELLRARENAKLEVERLRGVVDDYKTKLAGKVATPAEIRAAVDSILQTEEQLAIASKELERLTKKRLPRAIKTDAEKASTLRGSVVNNRDAIVGQLLGIDTAAIKKEGGSLDLQRQIQAATGPMMADLLGSKGISVDTMKKAVSQQGGFNKEVLSLGLANGISKQMLKGKQLPQQFWDFVSMRVWGAVDADQMEKFIAQEVHGIEYTKNGNVAEASRAKFAKIRPQLRQLGISVANVAEIISRDLGASEVALRAFRTDAVQLAGQFDSTAPRSRYKAGAAGLASMGTDEKFTMGMPQQVFSQLDKMASGKRGINAERALAGLVKGGKAPKQLLAVMEEAIVNQVSDVAGIDQIMAGQGVSTQVRGAMKDTIARAVKKLLAGKLARLDKELDTALTREMQAQSARTISEQSFGQPGIPQRKGIGTMVTKGKAGRSRQYSADDLRIFQQMRSVVSSGGSRASSDFLDLMDMNDLTEASDAQQGGAATIGGRPFASPLAIFGDIANMDKLQKEKADVDRRITTLTKNLTMIRQDAYEKIEKEYIKAQNHHREFMARMESSQQKLIASASKRKFASPMAIFGSIAALQDMEDKKTASQAHVDDLGRKYSQEVAALDKSPTIKAINARLSELHSKSGQLHTQIDTIANPQKYLPKGTKQVPMATGSAEDEFFRQQEERERTLRPVRDAINSIDDDITRLEKQLADKQIAVSKQRQKAIQKQLARLNTLRYDLDTVLGPTPEQLKDNAKRAANIDAVLRAQESVQTRLERDLNSHGRRDFGRRLMFGGAARDIDMDEINARAALHARDIGVSGYRKLGRKEIASESRRQFNERAMVAPVVAGLLGGTPSPVQPMLGSKKEASEFLSTYGAQGAAAMAPEQRTKYRKIAKQQLSDETFKSYEEFGNKLQRGAKRMKRTGKGLLDFSLTNLHPMALAGKAGGAAGRVAGFGNKATNQAYKGGMLATMFPGGEAVGGLLSVVGMLGPQAAIAAGAILLIVKNWDKVKKGIGGGINAIKKAFGTLVGAVLGPFLAMFDRLSGKGKESGDKIGNAWKMIGSVINGAMQVISVAVKVLAAILRPVFTAIAVAIEVVVRVVRLFAKLLSGDVYGAVGELGKIFAVVFDFIRGIAATVLGGVIKGILGIPRVFINAWKAVLSKFKNVPFIGGQVKGVIKALDAANNGLKGLGNGIEDAIRGKENLSGEKEIEIKLNKKKAQQEGEDGRDAVEDGLGDDPIEAPEVEPQVNTKSPKEKVEEFISEFQNQMRSVVDGWKDAVMDAFEDYAKGQLKGIEDTAKAKEKAIDDELKGLERIEKEESRLEMLREYAARKEELRRKRLHSENVYGRERAKLIYEGNYDAAAELDVNHQEEMIEQAEQEAELERQHAKDLVQIERDRIREIADLKKQEIQETAERDKTAMEEQLEIKRQGLQRHLDEITRFIPHNVAAANSLQAQMLGALGAYTDQHGQIGHMQAAAWGSNWASAMNTAKAVIADQAWWAGKEAMAQFARAIGVDPATLDTGGFQANAAGAPAYTTDPALITTADDGSNKQKNMMGKPFHTGGAVGSLAGAPEDVPATLQTGEYVIQRKAVNRLGKGTLDRLNTGRPVFHTGGMVGASQQMMSNTFQGAYNKFLAGEGSIGGLTKENVTQKLQEKYNAMFGSMGFLGSEGDIPGQFLKLVAGLTPGMARIAKLVFGTIKDAIITSTTGGKHTSGSYHYKGQAIDFDMIPNGRNAELFNLLLPLAQQGVLAELFYDPLGGWKNGKSIGAIGGHDNHVHAAIANGFNSGVFSTGAPGGPVNVGGGIKGIVKGVMHKFGFGEDQWPALEQLVQRESGWRPNAANPTSSARGLFQFLKSTWSSYITNKGGPPYWNEDPMWQAQGGLNYIKSRYGSPQRAMEFWNKNHWYHKGGMVYPSIPKLDTGGLIAKSGIAEVHKGERVLNRAETQGMGSEFNLNLHFDGGYFGSDRELEKLVDTIEQKIVPKINRAKGLESRKVNKI